MAAHRDPSSVAATLKAWAKRLVPEKYRLLRYEWYETLRYYPELVASLGRRFTCPFCGWHFRRLRTAGFDLPVLRETQVVGATCHPDDVCPRCMSNARERLAYVYLKRKTATFIERLTLLHIAPEPHLGPTLRQLPTVDYVSGDLFARGVDVTLDLTMLPFRANSFDLVICNHVLEHVADDRAAIRELHRVLKPDRTALLQVPIGLALEDTLEDPTAVTDAARTRSFGQRDHVRLYAARDYMNRLAEAGFQVFPQRAVDSLGEDVVERFALLREELVFLCHSAPSQSGLPPG